MKLDGRSVQSHDGVLLLCGGVLVDGRVANDAVGGGGVALGQVQLYV